MTINNKLITRCEEIISLGRKAESADSAQTHHLKANELFYSFKSSLESFILLLYGKDHPHFIIVSKAYGSHWFMMQSYFGVLNTIKSEIEQGWISTVRGLVSAEIFADFLEMADHLLNEKYKDPAAVLVGGVLEEHLRQMCLKNNIETEIQKEDKSHPKKADQLNSELSKADVYNKLDQKSITSWLDLRNKAAHAKYDEYTQGQVELMLQGVLNFINRNPI